MTTTRSFTVTLTDGSTRVIQATGARQAKLLATVAVVGEAMRAGTTLAIARPTRATPSRATPSQGKGEDR